MAEQRIDVCVVGAGAAGIACAQGLARRGASVVLLERLHPMPDNLKAEKIDGEVALSLMRLGFGPAVEAALTPLYSVAVFFGERALGALRLDPPEAGALYFELINKLREHLDPRVDFRPGTKAASFEQKADAIYVVTDKGERINARLVVLATGDARQLLEPLGATYEALVPHHVFVSAFTLDGALANADSATYHHPIKGGPVAYITLFRLGETLRANIFCPGTVSDEWQRDLKQRPLETLTAHNRLFGMAARDWRIISPVMIRKVNVLRLNPPVVPRIVALGDAAHTIDPSGGGGLTFSLMEAELLLGFYLPRWLDEDTLDAEAIDGFYTDPRRVRAVHSFFDRGRYIFDLNHDPSLLGRSRRLRFALRHLRASRLGQRPARSDHNTAPHWHLPAPFLYEDYASDGS